MASRGYGDDFYRGIELGIQATGQQGVSSLAHEVQNLQSKLALYQAQLATGAPLTTKEIAEFAQLRAEIVKATEAYQAAQRVMAGMPAQLAATGNAARGASDAMLQLSRGLEDLSTGGFIGILNNLPGIARGIGTAFGASTPQIAAAETAVSLLGTAGYLAYTHLDTLKRWFDDGLSPKPLETIKQMKDALEDLTAKDWKVKTDVTDIRNLSRELEEAERIKKGLAAASGPTDDQEKAGKIVQEAAKEGGGAANIKQAIYDVLSKQDSGEVQDLRKRLDEAQKKADNYHATGPNDFGGVELQNAADRIASELKKQGGVDTSNLLTRADNMLGRAAAGIDDGRRQLAQLYDANKSVFANNQVAPSFREALDKAAPAVVAKERTDKEAAKKAVQDEQAQREADREGDENAAANLKKVREAVADIRGGVEKGLVQQLYDAIKAGADPAEAQARLRDQVLAVVRQRNVDPYARGLTADQLLSDAADKAQNHLQSGTLPGLKVAEQRQRDKEARQREQEVNKHVAAAQGGYADEAEATIYRGLQAGKDADALQAGEMPALTKALRDRGNVPPQYVADVAKKILAAATEKALNDLDSGQAPKQIRQAQSKQDAADKKQIADVGGPFLEWAETLLARNRAALKAGVPVAKSDADIARYKRSGADYALPEGEAQRRVGADLAQGLKNTGQDPALAIPMVKLATEKLGDSVSRAMATGANEQQALIAVMHDLADQFGQIQQHVATSVYGNAAAVESLKKKVSGLRQRTAQVGHQVNRGVKQRPSTIQFIP